MCPHVRLGVGHAAMPDVTPEEYALPGPHQEHHILPVAQSEHDASVVVQRPQHCPRPRWVRPAPLLNLALREVEVPRLTLSATARVVCGPLGRERRRRTDDAVQALRDGLRGRVQDGFYATLLRPLMLRPRRVFCIRATNIRRIVQNGLTVAEDVLPFRFEALQQTRPDVFPAEDSQTSSR